MQELASWRELRGKIIADSHERQRIANMLGVNPITLTRWVNNESKPRPQNLRQLLDALPEYHSLLLELIATEFEGNIAGSLLVSSTQPDYFVPSRLNLVTSYADLIGLAFGSEEFYGPECIDLYLLPPPAEQRGHLSRLRQRLIDIMMQARRNSQPIHLMEAEQLVWQQIEEELLQFSLSVADKSVENNQEV